MPVNPPSDRSAVGAPSAESRPALHRVGDLGAQLGRGGGASRRGRYALGFGLAALIFGFLVWTVASQWSELRRAQVGFDGWWLVPGVGLVGLFYVLMGYGWDLVLRFLGYELAPARAQMVWGQSLLARYVPGSVLFVLGRVLLAEREGVPRRATLASVVYELGLQFAAAAMVASYFFVDHPDLQDQPVRWAVLVIVPAALVGFHPRVFGPIADGILRRLGRDPLPSVMPFRGVAVMLVFFAVVWVVIGVGLFFVGRAIFPLEASVLPTLAAAQSVAFIAAVLTVVTPSGLGVRDGAFAWAAAVAVPGGFAVAAAIAIASRLVMTVVELVYVGVVSALGRRAGLDLHHEPVDAPAPDRSADAERVAPGR